MIRLVEPTRRSLFPEPLLYYGAGVFGTGGYTRFVFEREGAKPPHVMILNTDRDIVLTFERQAATEERN